MTEHLHLAVPSSRLDDPDYCRRMAMKHRDQHLGLTEAAAINLQHAAWWEARAEEAERLAKATTEASDG